MRKICARKGKRTKKKKQPAVWLIIFAVLAAAFIYHLRKRAVDYTRECLRAEQDIGLVLLNLKVPEKSISTWRIEKRKNGKKWIEINKKIKMPGDKWETFFSRLENLSAGLLKKTGDNTIYLVKNGIVLCRITLEDLKRKPRLTFVIDDCGRSKKEIALFTELGIPLTFSILPYQRHTAMLAESLARAGFETLLHLPMEPREPDRLSLGKDALFVKMNKNEIEKVLEKNIEKVPFIKGVNNHMGSLFTENAEKMEIVLRFLKGRGLFFLDSATSSKSACLKTAEKAGIYCLRNNIFLDNTDDLKKIKKQIAQAIKIAEKKGYAIAIGHATRKYTARAIGEMGHELSGVEIVSLDSESKEIKNARNGN
ncbi:MAG: divergent polysaccharide deacetylase family protein [bacterium]